MGTPVLSLRDITLSYGANLVLDGISISLAPGETAALVGENGAGKSSLAKIIAGAHRPTSGTVEVAGHEVHLNSPRSALENGIAFIPQELIYAPQLTVAENILLGRLPTVAGLTRKSAIVAEASKIAEEMGFDLPLSAPMGSLSIMQQQLVEVLKAFSKRPKVLVLDEPTAALEAADSNQLLHMMSLISRRGVGILYISHRLNEVFRSCDTIHVLRGGKLVLSGPTDGTQPDKVVHAMLDRALDETLIPKSTVTDRVDVLEVQGWNRQAFPQLKDVSFKVRTGEIVGLYGIRGSGAETIAEGLVGLVRDIRGRVMIRSEEATIPRNAAEARRREISYIPADRKSQGLLLGQSILRSIALPALRMLTRAGFIDTQREGSWGQLVLTKMSVKYRSPHQGIAELSGGNQQKILVGSRTLDKSGGLVVVQEPTRGVDVGSRRDIHLHLRELAETGIGILLVSTDLDESINLSDRLLVLRNGSVVNEIAEPNADAASEIISYAGGLVSYERN